MIIIIIIIIAIIIITIIIMKMIMMMMMMMSNCFSEGDNPLLMEFDYLKKKSQNLGII